MLMIDVSAMLEQMEDEQRTKILRFCSILAGGVSHRILAYLETRTYLISADAIPAEAVGATRPEILTRLSRLKHYGLVESCTNL